MRLPGDAPGREPADPRVEAGAGSAAAARGRPADPVEAAGRAAGLGPRPATDPDLALRRRYEAYVRDQAARLPHLLPREAIRPLYREAVARARRRGDPVGEDPMETLVACCRDLLPLPPFEVWRTDFIAHREAHLRESGADPLPPSTDPVVVDVRALVMAGREWSASLSLRADEHGGWRGHVTFQAGPDGLAHRTAEIFAESDPDEIRARFADFRPSTLEAFLRSVLPG